MSLFIRNTGNMKPSKIRRLLVIWCVSLLLLQACEEPTTGPVLTLAVDENFGYSFFEDEMSAIFEQQNLFWESGRSLGSGGSADKVIFFTEVEGENRDYALFKTPVPPVERKGGEVVALIVSNGFFDLPPSLLVRVRLRPEEAVKRGFLTKRLDNVLSTGNPSVLPGSIPAELGGKIEGKSVQKMAVLDLLINQADRHVGNMLLVPKGDAFQAISIDNEVTLRVATPLPQLLLSKTPGLGDCKTSFVRLNCKFTPIWVEDELLNPFIKTPINQEIASFLEGLDTVRVIDELREVGASDAQLFLFRICATVVKDWSAAGKTIEQIYDYYVDPNGLTGSISKTAAELRAFLQMEFPDQAAEKTVSSKPDFANAKFFELFAKNSRPL